MDIAILINQYFKEGIIIKKNAMLSNITINYKGKQVNLSTKFRNSNNELIFLIHGLGSSKESFEHIWDCSLFQDYSILTLDLVGFGNSSKPNDFSYTMEEQAEICKLLLDEFEHPKIHIVAHSMGGAVGLLLVESLKDRLISFINIEGNLVGEDCRLVSKRAIGFYLKQWAFCYERKSRWVLQKIICNIGYRIAFNKNEV